MAGGVTRAFCLIGVMSAAPAWAGGLSLYEHPRFRGEKLFIADSEPDLEPLGFAARASSVRVKDGRWRLCTKAAFKGNCREVTGEIVDLSGTGLNDRVRSVEKLR